MDRQEREITKVTVRKAQIVDADDGPVVLYQVDLANDYREWTCLKRFKMFKTLEEDLRKEMKEKYGNGRQAEKEKAADMVPKLPKRRIKFMVDHLDEEFIERRKKSLEGFCNQLIEDPQFANHPAVLKFFLAL